MKAIHLLPLFAASLSLRAADFPPLTLPEGVGVNIHFTTGHERDLDLIAAAGIKFVRMDFGWESIERERGRYDWSAYDQLTEGLTRRGLRALYILDYSNPLYEGCAATTNPISGKPEAGAVKSPQTPESVAAFARWAGAAAKHFQGRRVIWEIWNEPNIFFWRPKPDVEQYTTLALATVKAVRAADPAATIVGPASSEFPWAFLESFFKAGALEHLDAVSVHPYRNYKKGPETASADYTRLRELMDRYAPESKRGKLPILSGEWGYSSATKGVSLETQANFVARQQLANLLAGVPISIWYDWKNDGPDPAEHEHNFGLVYPDLRPKPAYTALQNLTRSLSGCSLARRVDTTNAADFLLVLTNRAGDVKLAAWTTGESTEATLRLSAPAPATLAALNLDGTTNRMAVLEDRWRLPLNQSPVIVDLGKAMATEPER
jgi:hypothetical protein